MFIKDYFPRYNRIVIFPFFLSLLFTIQPTSLAIAATIDVTSDITTDTTWTNGNVYYVKVNATVLTDVTLTIEAGAIVKFQNDRRLLIDGKLMAKGTSGSRIYFTSHRDDSIGGDTNNDGSTTGAKGDWSWLEFRSGSDDSSLIEYATFRYGGEQSGTDYGTIYLRDASPTILNSIVSNSYTDGIYMSSTLDPAGSSPVISNTEFSSNNSAAVSMDPVSLPKLTGNSTLNNGTNGLEVRGGTISSSTAWDQTNIVYRVVGNVTVGGSATLTVAPAMIVKFDNDRRIYVDGKLNAAGTSAKPIYFTSYRDDSVGGDTNGNGSSTGSKGDWSWLEFRSGSDDSSLIDYATFRYGGEQSGTDYGMIYLRDSSPTIRNSVIASSYRDGIYAQGATPNLQCNEIVNNSLLGIRNATPGVVINAVNQYWGSPSGPHHPTKNPGGTDNGVSDGINFIPWRTSPCDIPESLNVKVYLPSVLDNAP